MFDLNEDLILEVFDVRWLMWVQLLVAIFLLFVVLCGFSSVSGDVVSNNPTSSFTLLSSNHSRMKNPLFSGSDSFQVEGIDRVQHDMDAIISRSKRSCDGEESRERELSTKDAALSIPFGRVKRHPCSYLGLAKEAILKCFGLDALFENSYLSREEEEEEEEEEDT